MSKESTGKRITDELRTGGIYRFPSNRRVFTEEELTAIADRIDKAYKEALQREHETAYDEGYDEGFASADDALSREENGVLEEHGWYRALDADKKPIKFGDEVEWRHPCGSCELRHGIVTGIKTDKIGDEVFHEVTVNVDRFTVRLMASQLRHYHAPTVEDVLREFADEVQRCCDTADTIAEYAAKLRLAGDAE